MTSGQVAVLVVLALSSAGIYWRIERKRRAYPARRMAGYHARARAAETPAQLVTVAAEYLAATLRYVPDGKRAWMVARAHADELTKDADELHKYVPRKGVPQ